MTQDIFSFRVSIFGRRVAAPWTYPDVMQSFADWLIASRKKIGLTQQELAERIGMAQRSISRMERGEGTPNRNNVKRIAQFFDEEPDRVQAIARGRPIPDRPDDGISITVSGDTAAALESLSGSAGLSVAEYVDFLARMMQSPTGDVFRLAAYAEVAIVRRAPADKRASPGSTLKQPSSPAMGRGVVFDGRREHAL